MTLTFEPKKVALILGTIITGLILANFAGLISTYFLGHGRLFGLIPLFDLNKEHNIPTLFSAVQILLCSGLLSIIGFAEKRQGGHNHRYWLSLAAIFLFISIDEVVKLHERLNAPVRTALNTSGLLYFAWVIPYAILVVILIIIYSRFLLNLPSRIKGLTIIAGVIYIAGAIGFELIGGHRYQLLNKEIDLYYALITSVEESLEMVGILIFVYALMSYIDSELKDLHFRIVSSLGNSPPLNIDK